MKDKSSLSSVSFRQSLESRLQLLAKETGTDLQRLRRKIAFERFLCRLFLVRPSPWVLKGGYALEVRFEISRATKDLDLGTRLNLLGSIDEQRATLHKELQKSMSQDLEDHFVFRIEASAKFIESAPGGGFRFSVRSMVAGKLFVSFPLDVGMGDALTPPIEEVKGDNFLGVYGISPASFDAISLEQQFAEKIHAMTIKRGNRENSRVKDLVDVVLLIQSGMNPEQVMVCLENTFQRREKKAAPSSVPPPPDSWRDAFQRLADECGLNIDFDAACDILSSFLTLTRDKIQSPS